MARLLRNTVTHTPDLLTLAEQYPDTYPYFLNSSAQQVDARHDNARYDILLACPQQRLVLSAAYELSLDAEPVAQATFLEALDACHARERIDIEDRDLPFRGGWFVYLGYELAAQIETRLARMSNPSGLPVACAVRIPAAIIHDRQRRQTTIVAEPHAADCLTRIERDVEDLAANAAQAETRMDFALQEAPGEDYLQQVKRIKRYIVDGDVFQVNLSRQWQGQRTNAQSPVALYRRLVRTNPAPFAALARLDHCAVLSSSPERLVRREGEWVETRPIAGTHPRLGDEAADRTQREALMAHPKERAEHIMLIDLERNDLGRICEPGSVEVSELMVLESYAHVHHIVSNVRGRLRPQVSAGQIIAACFPGGTITGCPKVRCMEIISELEQQPRGAYTGSLGYLNHDGDLDLNILIRTIVVEADRISFRAGAGIVADSDPQRELEETRAKAKGMLLALHSPQAGDHE